MDKIFNINYVFRDEPHSSTHHHQFIMLEWYRLFATYEQILQDTKNLIASILENPYQLPLKYHQKDLQWHEFTIHELFQRELDINLAQFPKAHDLKHLIQNQFNSQISLPNNDLDWDDYFFLIFLNLIEPKLRKYPFLILKEYPASQASLSQINKKNNTCFRFEMYINGVEIANCFQEEINLEENINRFKNSNRYKMKNYGYQLPEPFRFYESIKKIKPCSGIALGVERLYMSLLDTNHIFFDRLL
jgi:lysyl-tRNA synthetase class 2